MQLLYIVSDDELVTSCTPSFYTNDPRSTYNGSEQWHKSSSLRCWVIRDTGVSCNALWAINRWVFWRKIPIIITRANYYLVWQTWYVWLKNLLSLYDSLGNVIYYTDCEALMVEFRMKLITRQRPLTIDIRCI